MAGNLLDTYVIGFDRAIRETVETKGGKLRPYVQLATGDLFRKEGVYQRTSGGGLPAEVTNRFGDSPVSDIDYSRRRTSRTPYHDGQFMDWVDLSKMGTDPRNAKLNVMRNKFLRREDLTLDTAILGLAKGGTNGTTDVYLTNAVNNIYDGATAPDVGFKYDEAFIPALQQFGNNNVDIETDIPVFKISWNQWRDMMKDDNFINFDYTAARPIDGSVGQIYDYMGAKFCISNILPYFAAEECSVSSDGSSDDGDLALASTDINTAVGKWSEITTTGGSNNGVYRAAYAFVKDASLLEINPDMTTKVSERADKSFNYYAYMKAEFGAVRMEEEKVVVIPCKEGV